MIPRLPPEEALHPAYRAYLEELRSRGFTGEVRTDYASRLVVATDNSVYQLVPQAVLFPRTEADVSLALALLAEQRHQTVKLSPRGGGTGTNGQALCDGIILDVSRHLREILELNLEQGWVRVQPGVVLDQLNAFLAPHGVFFAPNLSPSNRATIGGMVNTDACGKGSRIYGKTSNHVIELRAVLRGGVVYRSRALTPTELEREKARTDVVGEAMRVVDDVVTRNREKIAEEFPKLQRFLTGYNLAHVWNAERSHFNLNFLLSGAEGTLGVLTEARLKLTPLAKHKQLVALRYGDFDAALRAANLLVRTNPGAIETVDDTIVGLAKGDVIWSSVAHLVEGANEPPVRAINLVEYQSDDPAEVERKVVELLAVLEAERGRPGAAVGWTVATKKADIAALWNLRKKGVGLLGNVKGRRRPQPFVEDTAVPPEKLADFIVEFRAILDRHQLRYGMFGHVDVGCLHVRPALDLRDENDEHRLREISDAVVALVKRYGGVLWSEHGKGFRSEYSPVFFGPELYEELRRVKAAFDPYNQLNPGKLATPAGSKDKLVSVDAMKRGAFDRQITPAAQQEFEVAIACNGNGACFDWNPDSVMCPSSKVTRDRIHSPKGRAGIMREWLRQMSRNGYDPAIPASVSDRDPARSLVTLLNGRERDDDFSHEVYDAMNGCLACKACATQCPVKVDVPSFRARFFELYHSRYRRPLRDYFFATLEKAVGWMAVAPALTNKLMALPASKQALEWVGIVDTPPVSEQTLARGLRERNARFYDPRALGRMVPEDRARCVLLAQDAFTSYFESNVALAAYDLLTALGFDVWVLPFRENGKGLHVKGFLSSFRAVVERNTRFYEEVAKLGVPIVGVEPAVTLTYRDEYAEALGTTPGFEVFLLQEFLATQLPRIKARLEEQGVPGVGEKFQLFGHCTEKTAAQKSTKQWQSLFEALGAELAPEEVGCCGMCGAYGHEAAHADESRGVFELSWAEHLPDDARGRLRVVATGHSCRSQVKRFAGFVPKHPAEVLVALLNGNRRSMAPKSLPLAD